MKPKFTLIATAAVLGCLILTLNVQLSTAFAQGSAFTYQGRLNAGSGLANGSYDFSFQLFDAPTGGAGQGGPIITNGITLTDGLFTVTLDFGPGPFTNGAPRWLEIATRASGGGSFSTLNPRQALTAAPYAVTAGNLTGTLPAAQLTGSIPSAQLAGTYSGAVAFSNAANSFSGTFSGNGGGLTNVNAATLGGLRASNFWTTAGNAGTAAGVNFIGTTDNQPLELWVNNQRAFRLEPNTNGAPNVIAGSPVNFAAPNVIAATIGGGGVSNYFGVAYTNATAGNFSTVSGGGNNQILANSDFATIGGGGANLIEPSGYFATIGGGYVNTIETNAQYGTIAGGFENAIQPNAISATIGGGQQNIIQTNADFATIGGGFQNLIQTNNIGATIGGGYQNLIDTNSSYAVIAGGHDNYAGTLYAAISGGHRNTNAGYFSFVGGGDFNVISSVADHSVIAGGGGSQIAGSLLLPVFGTIGGGQFNGLQTNAIYGTVGGGQYNIIQSNATYGTIGGGSSNSVLARAAFATIPGGYSNTAAGAFSLAAGHRATAGHDGAFVWADASSPQAFSSSSSNQFLIRAAGGVGIGKTNPASALDVNGAVIAAAFQGNGLNLSNVNAATLAGLSASNFWTTAGNAGTTPVLNFLGTTDNQPLELRVGGVRALRLEPTVNDANHLNIINVIAGSRGNFVSNGVYGATIAGGGAENYLGSAFTNSVSANFGTVGGGFQNLANGVAATVGGGAQNTADFSRSTVGGGERNVASGTFGGAATVGGGSDNKAIGDFSTIGGGQDNTATAYSSAIGGGFLNTATNLEATVAGGFNNLAGGAQSTVAGGDLNTATGNRGTVGGGERNVASGESSTVSGGDQNTAGGDLIAGYATVPGGRNNLANGNYSFAAGYQAQALHDGAFVWADAIGAPFASTGSNQFLIRASGGVGIGTTTPEAPLHVAESSAGTVTANANSIAVFERGGNGYLSVLGPVANEVGILFGNPNASTDGGIVFNNPSVPNGLEFRTGTNVNRMTILASGNVGIGTTSPSRELEVQSPSDTEIGLKSTDAGGHLWTIQSSGVAGSSRDASFQIIDRTTNSSRLLIDTNGFVGIGTTSPTNRLHVNGGITCTALVQTSDRNAKENFAPVSPSEVLAKVTALPITTWNFKAMHDGRHMGPMAQDFYAAFGLGGSDTTITAVDPDGVALAAIQGLNQKLEEQVKAKDAELVELRKRLERIEQILHHQEKNEE